MQSLPSVVHLPAAIPIIKSEAGKAGNELRLDIAGSTILCTRTLPVNMIHNLVPSDITLVENQLVDIQPLKPAKLTKVMAVSRSQSYIEDKLKGIIPVTGDFPVYQMQDNIPSYRGNMSVLVGSANSTLYYDDDAWTGAHSP